MRKKLIKGLFGLSILLPTLMFGNTTINKSNTIKELTNYQKRGLKTKEDLNKYREYFNIYTKGLKNKKIDNSTKILSMDINKNNELVVKKELDNLKYLKKPIEKYNPSKKEVKEFVGYISKILLYDDAYVLCKKLAKIHYFKVGGKYKEIVKDNIYNRTFNIEISNPDKCQNIKKDFENTVKKSLFLMKKIMKNK